MRRMSLTRRVFLRWATGAGLLSISGCAIPINGGGDGDGDGNGGNGNGGNGSGGTGGMIVFRRSGRNRRVSNAAKKHNANRLYKTPEAAASDAPHRGDSSRVVQVTIPMLLGIHLFPPGRLIVDLRRHL
jgi:hypothetical protein